MSLSSWLRALLAHRVPRRSARGHRKPGRRPIPSRPFLEHLEERTLPDASSGIIPAADHPAFNSALISGGFVTPTAPSFPTTTSVTSTVFPTSGGASSLAVTSSFPDQDQPGAQFRAFGVNNLAEGGPFSPTTSYTLLDAYGFGSGVVPSAPWMPSAYNLGLANHQFNYPAQSDLGFQSAPPWSHAVGLPTPDDPPRDVGDVT